MMFNHQSISRNHIERRRNVVFVTDYWYPRIGGLESSIKYLLGALEKDVVVDLFTTGPSVTSETTPAQVWRFPSTKQNSYYDKVFQSIVEMGRAYPIVHIFGFSFLWPDEHAELIRRLVTELGARIILKVPTSGDATRILAGEFRSVKNLVTAYIALNSSIVDELLNCEVERERIVEISNGVPLHIYKPCTSEEKFNVRQHFSFPQDRPVIGFAGRLVTRKRLDLVIDAIRKLPRAGRPKLALMGDVDDTFGDQFSPADSLNEDVLWIPGQHDTRNFYHALDAYVCASEAEGMPNAVLEAMASGLPVVLSDIPGQRQLVPEGQNGWLFPKGNLDALCNCLTDLYQKWSIGGLAHYGTNSRQLVDEFFDENIIADKYIDLYNRVSGMGARR